MEEKSQITSIIKLIPFGAVFITLCSSINLIIYYGMFNIRIINYLTIQEYASLFMEHIIGYLLIIVAGYIYHLISIKWFVKKDGKWPMVFGITVGIIANIIFLTKSDTIHHRIKDFSYILYLGIFLTFHIKRLKNVDLSPILYIATVLVIFSITSGFSSGYKVMEQEGEVNYHFKLKSDSIKTSKKIRYLGKTQMYSFFHDMEKKESKIISNEGLLEIVIREKK